MATKKVATVAPKKAPAKKAASKSKRDVVTADGPQCFWVTNGAVLSNILELRDALEAMTDAVYEHHVTSERNDFADWVEGVLNDAELAKAIRKAKKAGTAHTAVITRLRVYNV